MGLNRGQRHPPSRPAPPPPTTGTTTHPPTPRTSRCNWDIQVISCPMAFLCPTVTHSQEGPLLDSLVAILLPGVQYVAFAITSRDSAAPDFRLLTSRGISVTVVQTGGA